MVARKTVAGHSWGMAGSGMRWAAGAAALFVVLAASALALRARERARQSELARERAERVAATRFRVGVGVSMAGKPVLLVRTEAFYGCNGYELETAAAKAPGRLEVALLSVREPEGMCGQVLSSADAEFHLDRRPEEVELTLRRGTETDVYLISTRRDGVELAPVRLGFSSPDEGSRKASFNTPIGR